MSNYYKLGKISADTINALKKEVDQLKTASNYQWIVANNKISEIFFDIFSSNELKVQEKLSGELVQKVFYSDPGYGFKIHKDGVKCKSALNIAISSNSSDWVRWYDEAYIENIAKCNVIDSSQRNFGLSRNIDIYEYESIPFEDELRVETGDVYILNVDRYHSFKCNGPNARIIMQTKFKHYPTLEDLHKKISIDNFKNGTL
jgi:hypothetical protein